MQILITNNNLFLWDKEVNEHLEGGWTIVPNTLQISTSVSRDDGWTKTSEAYAVVVECPDKAL